MSTLHSDQIREFCKFSSQLTRENVERLDMVDQDDIVSSMVVIMSLVKGVRPSDMVIRPYRSGELGIIAHRHCVIYRNEYGFDDTFESYLLDGMSKFLCDCGKKGNVWVVDYWGHVMGSIAIVETEADAAQLRWFYLEPVCRGLGIGRTLMEAALDYCTGRGLKRVFLWTVKELEDARHLYEKFDFTLTETKEHSLWGQDIVEERWDLELSS
ncbi:MULTISPECIES: GNAT family N-acetyltransferase [Aminobacterium]|uniref:GNAT family N-acetyltransferase n=1 Tax=Aminobacterium TaxID=81466 RepID=UPI00257A5EE8|nr:GNAT family N-acetyltransferase [Aminobacterium sp. UBA4987]